MPDQFTPATCGAGFCLPGSPLHATAGASAYFRRVHTNVNLAMREIKLYRTRAGRSPVEDFLHELSAKQAQKVDKVLRGIREMDDIPASYFKKLAGTDGLWEVRVQQGGDAFRLLGFFDGSMLVVLVSAFAKKTEQTPKLEIELAQQRRRDYLGRRNNNG